MKSILVIIFLVAIGEISAELCPVSFITKGFGDCSASSVAELYFRDSINISKCQLFGELDFNSTSLADSKWSSVTDTCIQHSLDDIMVLHRTTPSGPGRPLTAAQCQRYNQTMQCRMDCLLTFDLRIPKSEKLGYIYLRAISCNETLFSTGVSTVFNNQNNIQPSFKERQSLIRVSMSASTTNTLSSNILSPAESLLSATITNTRLVIQSPTLSITQHIMSSPSSFPPSTPLFWTHIGNTNVTAAFSAVIVVLGIIALGLGVTLLVVLRRHKTYIQNTNSMRAEILVELNPSYTRIEALHKR